MTNKSFAWFASMAGQVLAVGLAFCFNVAGAQARESVILRFNQTQGSNPYSGLTSDGAGNLYGTTIRGGKVNCGTVFKLSPASGGKWTETVLFSFHGCFTTTLTPKGTLKFDKLGNLYGVLQGFSDAGEIYQLSKGADGTWSKTVIHTFNGNEGMPYGDLTWDAAGNLYGATQLEFGSSNGEVFELSPQTDGSWMETVLYKFPAPNGIGFPNAGVIFDSNGNLYGPTFLGVGGSGSYGAVYELSPQSSGPWTLTVVYNFTSGSGGRFPGSLLVFDLSGNLYGTTNQVNNGQVFELSPATNGKWVETTIHDFASGSDGAGPAGTLVFDTKGNLYGTTIGGGLGCNLNLCGTVYRLTPRGDGTWKDTTLHYFESADDGSRPQAGLLLDNAGHLFGTTANGGSRYGYGTVFEIIP